MKFIYFYNARFSRPLQLLAALLVSFAIVTVNIVYFTDINSTADALHEKNLPHGMEAMASPEANGKLAIVIDDFGQNREGVSEMMSINRHMTFAIMPFLTFSHKDAENAHERGYEVIVHLPLESYSGKLSWVGPRPILTTMSDNEVQQIVLDAFEDIPYASGANIHMGAKADDDERIMGDILDVIKNKNVYFVDSRTGRRPVGKKIADTKGIVSYNRDVFLDGKGKTKSYVKEQLRKAGEMALKNGKAIAVGHVGTEGGKMTAAAISEMLEEFDRSKIDLVYVSELEN